jgi:hypothetical protein
MKLTRFLDLNKMVINISRTHKWKTFENIKVQAKATYEAELSNQTESLFIHGDGTIANAQGTTPDKALQNLVKSLANNQKNGNSHLLEITTTGAQRFFPKCPIPDKIEINFTIEQLRKTSLPQKIPPPPKRVRKHAPKTNGWQETLSHTLEENKLTIFIDNTYKWEIYKYVRLQTTPIHEATLTNSAHDTLIFDDGTLVTGYGTTKTKALQDLIQRLNSWHTPSGTYVTMATCNYNKTQDFWLRSQRVSEHPINTNVTV